MNYYIRLILLYPNLSNLLFSGVKFHRGFTPARHKIRGAIVLVAQGPDREAPARVLRARHPRAHHRRPSLRRVSKVNQK